MEGVNIIAVCSFLVIGVVFFFLAPFALISGYNSWCNTLALVGEVATNTTTPAVDCASTGALFRSSMLSIFFGVLIVSLLW